MARRSTDGRALRLRCGIRVFVWVMYGFYLALLLITVSLSAALAIRTYCTECTRISLKAVKRLRAK